MGQYKKRHIINIKMEKNNELKKVGIKNHTCCYFYDIIKTECLNFDNTL